MPDELAARIDATATRTGKRWGAIFAELIAHYEMREQDHKRTENRRRAQSFLNRQGGTFTG